jgi:hypothetical protein
LFFAWKNRLVNDRAYLLAAIGGGWLAMTMLRTKDPRFTMPLLAPSLIFAGAWLQSWKAGWSTRLLRFALVSALILQAYAINFGLRWLPQEVVLMRGYQGSLRWDWNLYMQHYFHILGPPRREDWKQEEILRKVAADAADRNVSPVLALVPDLARFNATNFALMARLRALPVVVDHLARTPEGIRSFDGFEYVVMTEKDQGMSWTTSFNRGLNQIIMDAPRTFRLLGWYTLPDGNGARLYAIHLENAGTELQPR